MATDFLRRPAVTSKAMVDGTPRHAVKEAQFVRFRQQAQLDGAGGGRLRALPGHARPDRDRR
ncbi:DUF6192 family protein [Streptomyces sp. NPDC019531]|uniref:DUF6192 family protein n=1 Tax=Streptomyces sp. NPDC019531 TaxID=3365062 RepID=UPI00384F0A18